MKQKIKIYTLLLFCIFILNFEKVFANSNSKDTPYYILDLNTFDTIPKKYLEFSEGIDENASFKTLSESEWKKTLNDDQSFINGYWVRFSILNNTKKDSIGINYSYNNEKKVFIHNSNEIIRHPYWREKFDNWIDDKRIRTSYKLLIKSNETAQVYSFFRKKPFDRYMGKESLHRMTVSTWENIRTHQFVKIGKRHTHKFLIYVFADMFFLIY